VEVVTFARVYLATLHYMLPSAGNLTDTYRRGPRDCRSAEGLCSLSLTDCDVCMVIVLGPDKESRLLC